MFCVIEMRCCAYCNLFLETGVDEFKGIDSALVIAIIHRSFRLYSR